MGNKVSDRYLAKALAALEDEDQVDETEVDDEEEDEEDDAPEAPAKSSKHAEILQRNAMNAIGEFVDAAEDAMSGVKKLLKRKDKDLDAVSEALEDARGLLDSALQSINTARE